MTPMTNHDVKILASLRPGPLINNLVSITNCILAPSLVLSIFSKISNYALQLGPATSSGRSMPSPNLQSHPVEDYADSSVSDDDEVHKEGDVEIKVTQAPGYLCHIKATAKFGLPPDMLFRQIITHPNNEKIFRHMDRCSYRRVMENASDGKQKIEVAHEASWRFLFFSGTFTTNLIVEQDVQQRLMKFTLKPDSGGIMKKFVGWWQIDSCPEDPNMCITYLEQDLALGVYMPPPFDRILKGISCSQVRKIMEDVKTEVGKINRGQPTLEDWEKVQLTEIGVENGRI